MWKVVTSSNLNSLLKLFFYSPILTNNNLFLKIYYENIVVTFLKYDFLFFILFLLSLFSFHPYVFFFLRYLLHTRCPISVPTPLLFLFLPHSSLKNVPALSTSFFLFLFFFSPALSLCFPFFFYLIPEQSSQTQSRWVRWLLSSIFCLFFSFFFSFFFFLT